jgi:hypothetical protein
MAINALQSKLNSALTTNAAGAYALRTVIEGDQTLADLTLTGDLALADAKGIIWAATDSLVRTSANLMTVAGFTTWDFGAVTTIDFDGNVSYTGGSSTFGGNVYINETANTKQTLGLTINQGADDDEILALKSSDAVHTMTDITEADTYGFIKKHSPTGAGLSVVGMGNADFGLMLKGYTQTAPTINGAIFLTGAKRSGTGIVDLADTDHLINFSNNGTAKLHILGDGDLEFQQASEIRTISNGALTLNAGTSHVAMASHLGLLITDTDSAVEGDIWYDASEDKLKFKTAAGVETITSA